MDKITLTLSSQTYNTIIQAVQEIPWKHAQPVFQEIDPQIRAALASDGPKASTPSVPGVEEEK